MGESKGILDKRTLNTHIEMKITKTRSLSKQTDKNKKNKPNKNVETFRDRSRLLRNRRKLLRFCGRKKRK